MDPASGAPDVARRLTETEVVAYVLVDLAIILALARIVGWVFVKLNQPRIVGEIVAGILLGPTVLGGSLASGPDDPGSGLVNDLFPLQSFEFLNVMATLALVLFMFLVGLEVEQRFFAGRGRQIVILALAVTVIPFVIGFGVAAVLDEPDVWRVITTRDGEEVSFVTHALFIGAGLAVTAFPVMARILQEKNMLATEMGAVAIGAAAISLPLMFIVIASAFSSGPYGVPESAAVKLLLALGLAAFLLFVVRPALRWILDRRYQPGQELKPDVFALLLIGVFLAAAAADRIGVQALTGGFLFGAAVPQVPGLAKAVIERLEDLVVVVLIPVLLVVSGLHTDLREFGLGDLGGLLLFLVAMIVAKWGVSAFAGPAVGLTWRESNAVGVLMNCRGLEILIVGLIGLQAGILTEQMMSVFVLGAIATTLMTGPLFDRFAPKAETEREFAALADADREAAMLGKEVEGKPG
jgi:Kef-type K+ transport system membrane component KefB